MEGLEVIRNPKPMSKITILKHVLSFGILGLLIIVFAGNGLRIEYLTTKTVKMRGLWYGMKCTTDKECEVKSLKSMYDEGDIDQYDYYVTFVPWQVKVTLSLFIAGVIAVTHILFLAKVKNEVRTRPFVIALAFIIGGLILDDATYEGTRQIMFQNIRYRTFKFPWTLFVLALAGVLSLIHGALNIFINSRRGPEERNHDYNTWKPFPFLVEFVIMITSSILQVAVHAGAGISISIEHTNILLLNETHHNIETGPEITTMFGVWYVKIINGTHSTVMSRYDYIASLGLIESDKDVSYGLYALYVVIMTTIAIGTIITTILYAVGLYKREGQFIYKVRNYMLACLVIAGTVGLDMTASIAAEQKLSKATDRFSWGLCLLGISSVIDLIVACFNVFLLYKQSGRSGDQQTLEVPLSNMME